MILEFYEWIFSIPVWLILLILFFPITIDYLRIFGKIVFLEIHKTKTNTESYFRIHDKKISVLIPAHNEESCIGESIDAALSTFYPNKEIIVIDDGSTDDTYKIASKYACKGLITLVYLNNGGSKATALNFGYYYSTGDIIITMDADTRLERHSLEKIVRRFDDNDIVAISGNIIPYGDGHITNLLTNIQRHEYASSFEIGKRYSASLNILLIVSGAFAVFRRSVINWNGLFSPNTKTEDFDKSLQIQKIGKRISFAEKSYAYTFCPSNWRTWIAQRTRWSYGHLQTLLKNKDILSSSKYRPGLRLATLDTWILDVILGFAYFIGITVLGIIIIPQILQDEIPEHVKHFGYLMLHVILVYLLAESMLFFYSRKNSNHPQPTRMLYLILLMVFFYRPLLKIVTFSGYLKVVLGKKIRW